MQIHIYYKSNPKEPLTYEIELGEFRRLSREFQKFLEEGLPKKGVYLCRTVKGDSSIKMRLPVILYFDEISSIG